ALEMFVKQLSGEPRNTQKRLAISQQYRQMKQYERAIDLLNQGLKILPGEAQLLDMKLTICTEASNFRCALEVWIAKFEDDTAARRSAGWQLWRAGSGERGLPWLDTTHEQTGVDRAPPSHAVRRQFGFRRYATL